MKTCHCCRTASRDHAEVRRSRWRWRRGGEAAGWIVPSATLVLLPKCPVCVAAYVALFSGVGISLTSAAWLRTSVLVLCSSALGWLVGKRLWRRFGRRMSG